MTRWQTFGAVIFRRLPETIPQRDPIQIRLQQIFDHYEWSKSRYSQHELQHIQDIKVKKGEEVTDVISNETAQDREDRWSREKEQFKFAPYDHRLSVTQYLFVKSKFGSDIKDQWLLPQTTFDRNLGDINLIDTARRAIKDSLNIVSGYKVVSKVPSSVHSFKYPKKVQQMTGFDGATIFYLKAHLDQPNASVQQAIDTSSNERLQWVTLDEATKIVGKHYLRGLSAGLLHEKQVDVNLILRKASDYAKTIKKISTSVSQ